MMENLDKLKQAIGVEEPMLIDVLKWLSTFRFGFNLMCSNGILELEVEDFSKEDDWGLLVFVWNDSHYLKDQSEELINWLVSLI